MQQQPHTSPASATRRTLIATLRDAVEEWRKANGWSRESAAAEIVRAHETLGAGRATGIVFDPPTRDTFERMRVNADRIYRWLDDATKDRNHLPANFIPSLLYALPLSLRLHVVDDLLRPVGLGCRELEHLGYDPGAGDKSVVMLFRALVSETAEANVAVSELLDGETMGELLRAQRELTEAAAAIAHNLARVEAHLSMRSHRP